MLRGALGDAVAAGNLDKTAMAVAVPALLSVLLDQRELAWLSYPITTPGFPANESTFSIDNLVKSFSNR